LGCRSILIRLREFIFFFQAEDGIRDRNVTGVQTCALPILTLTKAQRQAAKNNDIPLSRVRQRIHQGWDVEKATTMPVRHKKKTHGGMTVGDKFITAVQLQIAEENGLNR